MKKTMLIAVVFTLMFTVLSLTGCDSALTPGNNGLTPGGDPDDPGNPGVPFDPTDPTDPTAKTDLVVSWPANLSVTRGKKLADISLAPYTNSNMGTFAWAAPSQSVGNNIGIFKYTMIFTPIDTTKVNTARGTVDVLVSMVDMQRIEAGSFKMGSPPGEPNRTDRDESQWDVALSSFYIGKYEITQKQYETVMGESFQTWYKKNNASWSSQDYGQGDDFPAYYISWYDALVFCNKLSMLEGLNPAYSINGSTNPADWGTVPTANNAAWNDVIIVADSTGYRLPTEAQWEYACRAGTTTAWYFGDADGNENEKLKDYEWTILNSYITSTGYITGKETTALKASPVGQKKPNAWGLYDMHGNISELCWDWKGTYPEVARLNPTGANSNDANNRTSRGGWYNGTPGYSRSSARGSPTPWGRSSYLGLRVVRPEGYTPQEDYSMDLSAIEYTAEGPDISRFMGWAWSGGKGFSWLFRNDGIVATLHCCGAQVPSGFYLLRGNILVSYAGDWEQRIEVTYVTMPDDDLYFMRDTVGGFQKFYRRSMPQGNPIIDSDPNVPIVITNDLLGSWNGEGGTYTFGSDGTLMIGSDEYAYLAYYDNTVLILGPLVDGQTTAFKQYTPILSGNNLTLVSDEATISLSK